VSRTRKNGLGDLSGRTSGSDARSVACDATGFGERPVGSLG